MRGEKSVTAAVYTTSCACLTTARTLRRLLLQQVIPGSFVQCKDAIVADAEGAARRGFNVEPIG